eukprot:2990074-Amphidinium_carterae.2
MPAENNNGNRGAPFHRTSGTLVWSVPELCESTRKTVKSGAILAAILSIVAMSSCQQIITQA